MTNNNANKIYVNIFTTSRFCDQVYFSWGFERDVSEKMHGQRVYQNSCFILRFLWLPEHEQWEDSFSYKNSLDQGCLGGSVVFIKVFLQGVDQFSNFPQVSSQFRNLRYYINQILKSVDIQGPKENVSHQKSVVTNTNVTYVTKTTW